MKFAAICQYLLREMRIFQVISRELGRKEISARCFAQISIPGSQQHLGFATYHVPTCLMRLNVLIRRPQRMPERNAFERSSQLCE